MLTTASKIETQVYLSLVKDTLHHPYNSVITPLYHHTEKSHCALWLQSGNIDINSKSLSAGLGTNLTASDAITSLSASPAVMLRFIVSADKLAEPATSNTSVDSEIVFSQKIDAITNTVLFRLDQVDFPAGAIAYRHTHPGPGIRYLVDGGLTLDSDHHKQTIKPGDAWFEDANSPVMATAISTSTSCFVRAMLLPLEYEERSTFTLQDSADANKPRLQTNCRHLEKRITLSDLF